MLHQQDPKCYSSQATAPNPLLIIGVCPTAPSATGNRHSLQKEGKSTIKREFFFCKQINYEGMHQLTPFTQCGHSRNKEARTHTHTAPRQGQGKPCCSCPNGTAPHPPAHKRTRTRLETHVSSEDNVTLSPRAESLANAAGTGALRPPHALAVYVTQKRGAGCGAPNCLRALRRRGAPRRLGAWRDQRGERELRRGPRK